MSGSVPAAAAATHTSGAPVQRVRLCHLQPGRRRLRLCGAVQGLDGRRPRLTRRVLAHHGVDRWLCSRLAVVVEGVLCVEELVVVIHVLAGADGAFGARGEAGQLQGTPTWRHFGHAAGRMFAPQHMLLRCTLYASSACRRLQPAAPGGRLPPRRRTPGVCLSPVLASRDDFEDVRDLFGDPPEADEAQGPNSRTSSKKRCAWDRRRLPPAVALYASDAAVARL